jgi:hypothetical protein
VHESTGPPPNTARPSRYTMMWAGSQVRPLSAACGAGSDHALATAVATSASDRRRAPLGAGLARARDRLRPRSRHPSRRNPPPDRARAGHRPIGRGRRPSQSNRRRRDRVGPPRRPADVGVGPLRLSGSGRGLGPAALRARVRRPRRRPRRLSPQDRRTVLQRIALATTPEARLFIDGGNPLSELTIPRS